MLQLLGTLGLDEGGKALDNPFGQCWRGQRHAAYKAEQREQHGQEKMQRSIEQTLQQISRPAKEYAECSPAERRVRRATMLKKVCLSLCLSLSLSLSLSCSHSLSLSLPFCLPLR